MTNSRSFLIGPSNELSFVSGFPLKDDQKAKKFYPKPSLYGTTLLPVYLGVIFDNKMPFNPIPTGGGGGFWAPTT